MLKRTAIGLGIFVAISLLVLLAGLTWAHVTIRRERAPLPAVKDIRDTEDRDGSRTDWPVSLHWINTASQSMPRAAVLDPKRDRRPHDAYVMSHPAFVLRWADGRMLLVDTGMTREGAVSFGRTIEMLGGASPLEAHGSAAERLAADRAHVQAIVFTHLHLDHVGGVSELCANADQPLHVFMTEAQANRGNYTTRPGMRLLRASRCIERHELHGSGAIAVPGYPGVSVIDAGGHTPGSQIVLARVAGPSGVKRYAFTGDTVNNLDGILDDVPKPLLYRLLMVPEDESRQTELRHFLLGLRNLGDPGGFTLLVSHDQRALEQSGIPPWNS
jgi:glyoxylase-like metal-dependent hydrolase (beta-lactamase superfamily II)